MTVCVCVCVCVVWCGWTLSCTSLLWNVVIMAMVIVLIIMVAMIELMMKIASEDNDKDNGCGAAGFVKMVQKKVLVMTMVLGWF